jgi:hypothetical protein
MLELTKSERKLAEVSVKRYRGLLFRKAPLLGWIGVVLFLLGILRIFSWLEPYRDLL